MHICFTISSLHCGGAERVVSTLANNFVFLKHKVSIVLVSSYEKDSFYKLDKSINLIPLLSTKKKTGFIRRVFSLRKKLKAIKPDVVVAFLPHICVYSYCALLGTKIPLVCSERNNPYTYSKNMQRMLKKIFAHSCGCVFQTNDARKFYGDVHDANSIVIPNPVYLNPKAINYHPKKENLFISVGRLVPQKRFDLLIKAFNEFRQKHESYKLVIYGDGNLKDELLALISSLNAQNYIELRDNNPDWHVDAKKSIALVSTSDFEGMPNCLEEALCLGCQCIATDCPIGGTKDLFNLLDAGYLVEPNSKEQLVIAMEQAAIGGIKVYQGDAAVLSQESISDKWIQFISSKINKM